MIPEIPVHPGNVRHGKQATWKTEMENNHGDTTVSASAPAFFHIEGVGQYGDKYEEQSGGGGVAVGSQPKHFENAAGVTTGGVTDDSSVSAEMPVWMNNNKHVHVRNSTQRSMGLGHIAGKPVPRLSNKDNNSGGYHQVVKKQRFHEQQQQGQQRQQQRQQNQQHEIEQLRQQLERAKQSYAKNPTQQQQQYQQPQQPQQQPQQKQQFVPASQFEGPQNGYAFKRGNQGTGYYIDQNKQPNHQSNQQSNQHQQTSTASRSSSFSQAGRQQMNFQPQTSSHPNSRPVTGSKPSKFPLSKPSNSNSHRDNRSKSDVPEPYPAHLKGPIPTDRFDAHALPLDMQHQYYTFSTPKHMRLQENMKMNPPEKYAPFMKR